VLQEANIDTAGLSSKSWEEFAKPGAPAMDLIITVCDNAAGEVCPIWPGHPATAHWGYADPAEVQGSDEVRHEAFCKTLIQGPRNPAPTTLEVKGNFCDSTAFAAFSLHSRIHRWPIAH
jgi:hypothetical protein